MYSEEEKKVIKEFERKSFRKLKEKENKNKDFSISDDILFISDFNLKIFPNSGDSGNLFLATNKYNSNEKYILKHEYYDCACNEYMYSKIGNKMGIKIAPVKLFILDDKEEKFKSDFVCGIKFFENCKHVNFDYIDKNKNNINNWEDYFRIICLESLFEEGDGIEIIEYNNNIFRLDMTDAFTISDYYIYPLAYEYNNNGINIRKFANKSILKMSERNTDSRIYKWKSNINYYKEKFGYKYFEYFLETLKRFEQIAEKDVEIWATTLTFLYPDIIGEYFKNYFYNLKLDVKQFLIEINEKNLVII